MRCIISVEEVQFCINKIIIEFVLENRGKNEIL